MCLIDVNFARRAVRVIENHITVWFFVGIEIEICRNIGEVERGNGLVNLYIPFKSKTLVRNNNMLYTNNVGV